MKKQKYRITGEGVCTSCRGRTEERQHIAITDKQLRQPFFYSKWYYCHNKDCKTTTLMFDKDRIMNQNKAAQKFKDYEEDQATLDFISNIR